MLTILKAFQWLTVGMASWPESFNNLSSFLPQLWTGPSIAKAELAEVPDAFK